MISSSRHRIKRNYKDKQSLVKTNEKHGFDIEFTLTIYLLQRDYRGDYLSPSGHGIGSNSLRGHSLFPADHSGPIAGGGRYLFPPLTTTQVQCWRGHTSSPLHDLSTCLVTQNLTSRSVTSLPPG